MRVLQDWHEIGAATLALQRAGLPTHDTVQKNWDQHLLWQLVQPLDRQTQIVDLGCGAGHALKLLHALGFHKVCGVDFQIGWKLRLQRLRGAWRQRGRMPFTLHRGDLTRTPLADASQQVVLSISTIEHGVDVERFLTESSRLLKPGGQLFVAWRSSVTTSKKTGRAWTWSRRCSRARFRPTMPAKCRPRASVRR